MEGFTRSLEANQMARILVEPGGRRAVLSSSNHPKPSPGLAGSAWWTKTRGTSAVIAGSRSASGLA